MDKIGIYESILDKDKENGQVWCLLGEEYINQGKLSEALYAFSLALKNQDPKVEAIVSEILRGYFSHQGTEDKFIKQKDEEGEPFAAQEEGAAQTDQHMHREEPAQADEIKYRLGPVQPTEPVQLQVIKGTKDNKVISLEDKLPKRVTFEDVGGLDSLKKTIEMKIIKPFLNPGLFSRFRKKTGGGILLYGPPGCGKTFIAQATAGECSANFYPVHISEILDPYVGVSEQNLHGVFETARSNSPSVLFFDEIDALGYSRAKSRSDVMRPLVDTMLAELQSVETNTEKLLVIGATNMPWDVDAAFKRPGRFDKLVFVPPPDQAARKIIFELKLRGKPMEGNLNLEFLAEKTENYSGADIENVVEVAVERVLTDIMETNHERAITMEDMLAAIQTTKPSTIEWLTTIKNYIKYSNQSGQYNDAAQYIKKHF
jgi:SpoVK/Ycf46/Vps4 family AAA+-type ATPase